MNRLITLCLAASATAVAAPAASAADLTWGHFKDNGCINPMSHPGLRAYSAVLWNIPHGQSWEETCARTPAIFDGVSYPHPVACVNTAIADPLALSGAAILGGAVCAGGTIVASVAAGTAPPDGLLELCAQALVVGVEGVVETVQNGYYHKPAQAVAAGAKVAWPLKLFGAVSAAEKGTWKKRLADALARKPVGQVRQNGGGLNIWGVFAVADASCLPPPYLGLKNANHEQAEAACAEQRMRVCRRDEICQGGQPVAGRPEGDVWAAVGDGPNAWVSVGTAYPERLCKLHEDAVGHMPAWGMASGPQPHTGKPTALRCCP
ncbi:MAG: hypothetical protein H6701_04850 [Myxococcales bacterium]|nr:hypothetical protein [Myxococcales bacterium]MCB9551761.1 hypothetical protein [Myxococcales bacterium]